MLTVVSWCQETTIVLFGRKERQSRLEIMRVFVAILASVGILVVEYRLTVPGLVTGILAQLLAGTARALHRFILEWAPETFHHQRVNILLCGAGLFITGAVATYHAEESWAGLFHALQREHYSLLLINALATATAILTGQSLVLLKNEPYAKSDKSSPLHSSTKITTLTFMVGSIGLASTLSLRRSYTSWYQLGFFLLATLSLTEVFDWNIVLRKERTYQKRMAIANSSDVESPGWVDRFGELNERGKQNLRRRNITRCIQGVVLLSTLWIPYLTLNFSKKLYNAPAKTRPSLDYGYHKYPATTDVEIVISMYKESVYDVAKLISTLRDMPNLRKPRVHIYIKDSEASLAYVQSRTGADKITLLPNVGREGETYLHHILSAWNTLAKHTVFLQADVHNPREFYPRIRNYFDPLRTGMLNLGWSGRVCSCTSCSDHFGWRDTTRLFPYLQSLIDPSSSCENVLLSYKGQFVVSSQRIRGISQSVYIDLHNALVNETSWAHQEPYLQGRTDSMSAPVFGYTVERIWNLLFQCSDMEVAWKCPTLLSGWRVGGGRGDCQCFDSAT
jgi:hypothetical protein